MHLHGRQAGRQAGRAGQVVAVPGGALSRQPGNKHAQQAQACNPGRERCERAAACSPPCHSAKQPALHATPQQQQQRRRQQRRQQRRTTKRTSPLSIPMPAGRHQRRRWGIAGSGEARAAASAPPAAHQPSVLPSAPPSYSQQPAAASQERRRWQAAPSSGATSAARSGGGAARPAHQRRWWHTLSRNRHPSSQTGSADVCVWRGVGWGCVGCGGGGGGRLRAGRAKLQQLPPADRQNRLPAASRLEPSPPPSPSPSTPPTRAHPYPPTTITSAHQQPHQQPHQSTHTAHLVALLRVLASVVRGALHLCLPQRRRQPVAGGPQPRVHDAALAAPLPQEGQKVLLTGQGEEEGAPVPG